MRLRFNIYYDINLYKLIQFSIYYSILKSESKLFII